MQAENLAGAHALRHPSSLDRSASIMVTKQLASKRLDGWKEIAGFFGRGTRTVQRWERELRLPVHRVGGRRRASVWASTDELAEWMLRRPEQASRPRALNNADGGTTRRGMLRALVERLLGRGSRQGEFR
jgi:hypothetical protein